VIFRKLDEHAQLAYSSTVVLDTLRRSGIDVDVWRPAQFWDGMVEAELDMVCPERPRYSACAARSAISLSRGRYPAAVLFGQVPEAACPQGQERRKRKPPVLPDPAGQCPGRKLEAAEANWRQKSP
jgi:hypothetical protein